MSILPSLLLLGATLTGDTSLVSLQTIVADEPHGQSLAVARVVGAVINYTRWPTKISPLRLCVAGVSPSTVAFDNVAAVAGRSVTLTRVPGGPASIIPACDILYLGKMAPADYLAFNRAAYGQAILTLTDADADCIRGSMFCLTPGRESVRFSLNLDAVSRSLVKVDPRVLQMARRQGKAG